MYTALGVSVYAGGFTLGMRRHFDVRAHFEAGTFGVETFKRNQPGIPVYTDRTRWPRRDYAGVDVIYANPPCSVWSICGRSLFTGNDNWKTDRNLQHSIDAMNLVFSMRPKIFALESVSLLETRGRDFIMQFAGAASEIGYATTLFQLDPKLWGLPQQRRRVFLIAHRVALGPPQLPPSTSRNPAFADVKMTVDDAISGLTDPGFVAPLVRGYDEVLKMGVKEGEQLARVWERAHCIGVREGMGTGRRLRGRPSFSAHRVKGYEPCDSIIGSSQAFIHPHEDRFLGSRELGVLCGFPEDYIWPQSTQAGVEIGKGVTVLAASILGQYLERALRENEPVGDTSAITVYDYRAKSMRLGDYSCQQARRAYSLVLDKSEVLVAAEEASA